MSKGRLAVISVLGVICSLYVSYRWLKSAFQNKALDQENAGLRNQKNTVEQQNNSLRQQVAVTSEENRELKNQVAKLAALPEPPPQTT